MPNVSIPLLDTSGEPIKGFNQEDHPQASICKNKSHNVAPKICLCGTASDTDIGIAKEELDPLCECKIYPIKILDLFHKCRTLKPERWNFSAETENALRKLKRKTRRRCVCFKAMGDDRDRESVSNADVKHPFQPQQALVDVHASYSSITFKRIWEDSGSMSDDTINDYLVNALNMTPSEVDHVKGFLAASSSRSLMDDSFVRFRMEQAILKQRFHTIFGDGYRNLEDFQNENGKLLRKLKVGFYRKLFIEPQMHMDDTDVTRKSVNQKGDIVLKQDRRKSRLAALEQKLKGDYIKKIKKKMERRAEEKRKLRKKRAIEEKLKKSQAAKEISVDELKITKLKKVANDLELSTVIDDSAWTVKVRKTSLEDEYEYIDDIVNRGRKSNEDPIVLPMLSLVKDVTPRGKIPKSNRSPRRQSIKAVSNEATSTAGLLKFQIKERLGSDKVHQTNEIIRSKKTHLESPETLVRTKPAHAVSRDLKDKIKLDKKKENAHACIATPAISFSKYENPKKKRKKLKKKTAVLLEENSKENKQAYVHAVSEISTCNNTADKILQMSPRQSPISQKPKMSVGDMLKQEIMQTGSSYGTRRKKLRRRLPRLSPLPIRPGSSYSEKNTDGSSSNPKSETFKDCPPPQNSCDSAKIRPKEEPSNVKSMLQSHQKQYVANVRARKKLQENVSFVYSTSSSANFELPELGVLLSSRPTSGSYETLYTRDKDFVAPNHQIEKLELLHDLVNKVLLPPIRPFGPSSVPAKKNAPAKSKSSSKAKDWLKTLDQANDGSKDKKNVSVISGNREKDAAKLKSTTQDDILPPVKIKITITSGRVPFEGSDGLEVDRYYADVAKTILRKQYEDKYMKEGKKNSKLINEFNKRTLTAKEKANETLKEILKERKRRNNTSLSLNASLQSSIRRKLLNPEYVAKYFKLLPDEIKLYKTVKAKIGRGFEFFENGSVLYYNSGEMFTCSNESGDAFYIFYKSGHTAVEYKKIGHTYRYTVMSDIIKVDKPLTVLATFDNYGDGIVYSESGKIRLKYNQKGGQVFDTTISGPRCWSWNLFYDEGEMDIFKIKKENLPFTENFGRIARKETVDSNLSFENINKHFEGNTNILKPIHVKLNQLLSLSIYGQENIKLRIEYGATGRIICLGVSIVAEDAGMMYVTPGHCCCSIDEEPARSYSADRIRRILKNTELHERRQAKLKKE